jgi:hypothetical protein
VNRKALYYIWHSVQGTVGESDRIEKLTNNNADTIIVVPNQKIGKMFTIEEFVVFFYHTA